MTGNAARLWPYSLVAFVLFLGLGQVLFGRPHVLWDRHARAFRAQATRLALLLTLSGRTRALAILYCIAFVVFLIAHLPLRVPVMLAISQVASQMVVELFKRVYRRTRPDYWFERLDTGHSYPSGHATTAIVTYGSWALIIACSALPAPARLAGIVVLAVWALGIDWSRLALGAHYFSDVLGGTLFGIAWLCALNAIAGSLYLVQ